MNRTKLNYPSLIFCLKFYQMNSETSFFLLALFVTLGGETLQKNIKRNIEYIGWTILLLIFILIYLKIHSN